ncbi:MFS transporter [Streptomyces sp. NPDC001070]
MASDGAERQAEVGGEFAGGGGALQLVEDGGAADRLPRRAVLVAANLGSAVTQGSVAALLLTGRYALWPVAALGFANGILAAFTTPALRGIVPELVPGDRSRQANALLGSVRNATKILGPSLSDVLAAAVGGGPAIAFDALTYLLAAGCLTRLSSLTDRAAARRPSGLLADIRDGWDAYRRIRWVRTVSLCFCVVNLVQVGTWQILGPVLTRQVAGAATWGFVLSARGAGLLLMSTLMYRLAVRHLLRLGVPAGVLGALPLLALGARLGAPWLIAAAFTAGLGSSVGGVAWDTSLQEHVPAHALSRVSSFDDLLSYHAVPVGQLAVGPFAERFGGSTWPRPPASPTPSRPWPRRPPPRYAACPTACPSARTPTSTRHPPRRRSPSGPDRVPPVTWRCSGTTGSQGLPPCPSVSPHPRRQASAAASVRLVTPLPVSRRGGGRRG